MLRKKLRTPKSKQSPLPKRPRSQLRRRQRRHKSRHKSRLKNSQKRLPQRQKRALKRQRNWLRDRLSSGTPSRTLKTVSARQSNKPPLKLRMWPNKPPMQSTRT
jgi:hypothetical protein